MPFARPSLENLIRQGEADIQANLPGTDATLRRTVLGVLARVIAGGLHGLYGLLAWIVRQALPDTATDWLARHANIWGINRKAASFAVGDIDFTGTEGSVILSGTELKRADGAKYITTGEVAMAGGTAIAPAKAVVAGLAGNALAGQMLTLTTPIPGVNSNAVVAVDGMTGGADEETDDALLTRLLTRIQEPPHGGADFDYVTWAFQVAGVTRAWAYPQEMGLGTVTVRFMMDDTYENGLPLAADEEAVQAHIDAARPVTAEVFCVAPVAAPLAFEISGLNPASQAVKDAIEAELKDLIARTAEPGETILISHIREAISIAAGETDHVLVSPSANVTHEPHQIAIFGPITWS